jgi:hypothetical protein
MTTIIPPGQARHLTASRTSPDLSGIPAFRRADARALLWSLTQHADATGQARPGLELLERETGLPETSIHAAAELLAAHGRITVTEHANGDDLYRVVCA